MVIDATAAAGTTSAVGAKIAAGRTSLASSYETFLSLLTTQLKNQDPTAPLDTNTFTQQLVQMSGVEQQLLTNDLLKGLTEKAGDGLTSAVGYIGKVVTAATDEVALQNKTANWTYALPREAAAVKLEVLDAAGRVVRAETGQPHAGSHPFVWDGKNQTGGQLPDGGVYSLRVTATDVSGAAIAPTVSTEGVVRAVEQAGGVPTLIVGGVPVPLSAVLAVRQAA
jgi:flagellar basal-body rod modification protein FlgD